MRLSSLILILALAVALGGFFLRKSLREAGAAKGASAYAGTLTILSPHWEGVRNEVERAFNEDRAARGELPVKFDWLDVGGTSDIIRYIRSSFQNKPDGIGVDLVYGGGTDPYLALKKDGLLEVCALPEEVKSTIGKDCAGVPTYDPEGYWYGVGLSGFGIIYNKVLLKKLGISEPASWSDLAKPEAFSWIASADPRKSGSVFMMYEIIMQRFGWEEGMRIVSAMSGNGRSFSGNAGSIPKDVALGEAAFGLCIDVYALNAIMNVGEDRLGFLLPPGETVITPDAIALMKGAPEPELAREFILFNLSEKGQKLWSMFPGTDPDAPKEYALLKMSVCPYMYEKYPEAAMLKSSPFKMEAKFRYNISDAAARMNIFRDYIGILFVDEIKECTQAWKLVKDRDEDDPWKLMFYEHPVANNEDFLELGLKEYNDPEKKAKLQTEWANNARKRYLSIIKNLK